MSNQILPSDGKIYTDLSETLIPTEQHIYHHSDSDGARVNVKVERNSRGFNYEATVTGAKTVDEAMAMLKDAEVKLKAAYGNQETGG